MSTTSQAAIEVEDHLGTVRVRARGYQLELRTTPPRAVLADAEGRIWSHLSLLVSLDRTDVGDESYDVGIPELRHDGGVVEIVLAVRTPAWESKEVLLRCTQDEVSLTATVRGRGTLATVSLLGGRAVLDNGACGSFWSSTTEVASVFAPGPTEPVQVVRPASSAVTMGVVGDASHGRLHSIFSPPPLCLALGREPAEHATHVPPGPWLGLALRAPVAEMTFTQMRYEPVDGGFRIALDYDGHTRVDGSFTTPALVLRPAATPYAAIEQHRRDLVVRGLAPTGPQHPVADWWREPMFCGWGAQCALAPIPGQPASHPYHLDELAPAVVPPGLPIGPDLARQDVYDELLATLASHGVVPGTIVIDDRWQQEYGTALPHPERWPDLRGWVAERHARGQRVLLWWKAWAPEGLPLDECVLDPAGRPVAVDPGNPDYLRRVERTIGHLLGPDGVDADGLKIDFTQRAPAGASLTAWSDSHAGRPVWGVAALHGLLRALYVAAKAAKPDALVITHTPHPAFADVCDMVRTNDVLERDPSARLVPVEDQLTARVELVRAAMPGHLIDTDQWPMPDRAQWRAYVERQADLGVPALYYVDRMDRSGEELTAADLALVARTWTQYRKSLTR